PAITRTNPTCGAPALLARDGRGTEDHMNYCHRSYRVEFPGRSPGPVPDPKGRDNTRTRLPASGVSAFSATNQQSCALKATHYESSYGQRHEFTSRARVTLNQAYALAGARRAKWVA